MRAVTIDYTNWRGERRERRVVPREIWFGLSPYHPDRCRWFLSALDTEMGEERSFAMDSIHSWRFE